MFYARRQYGYPWLYLVRTWRAARPTGRKSVLGRELGRLDEFFAALIERSHVEARLYTCVNGSCSVIWHPRRGNLGGGGPAGCSCDELEDPRDLTTARPYQRTPRPSGRSTP